MLALNLSVCLSLFANQEATVLARSSREIFQTDRNDFNAFVVCNDYYSVCHVLEIYDNNI